MVYMGSKSVVSVAYFVEDEKLKDAILQSDYIRNETLNRLCAMPSYKYKSLKWKNIYYDYFKRQVMRELSA